MCGWWQAVKGQHSECVCVCVCVYVHTYMYHVCVCVCTFVHVSGVYAYIHVSCVCVCVRLYMYLVCMHTYMYRVCVCVCCMLHAGADRPEGHVHAWVGVDIALVQLATFSDLTPQTYKRHANERRRTLSHHNQVTRQIEDT